VYLIEAQGLFQQLERLAGTPRISDHQQDHAVLGGRLSRYTDQRKHNFFKKIEKKRNEFSTPTASQDS